MLEEFSKTSQKIIPTVIIVPIITVYYAYYIILKYIEDIYIL